MKFKIFVLLYAICTASAFSQTGEAACGSTKNGVGPFDYRTERGNNLHLVESMHFTQPVESLIKGNTDFIGKDLDYTLRAFPNHHRALMSVIRYGERTKLATAPNMPRSIECYLDRAIRFSPDDAISRILYSMFLAKNNRKPEAIQQLDTAASGAEGKENPFTHYNLGLNYFDLKEYEKSEIQAKKAYGMGFKQPTLKENLKSVGKWTEPEADPPTIPAPAASN